MSKDNRLGRRTRRLRRWISRLNAGPASRRSVRIGHSPTAGDWTYAPALQELEERILLSHTPGPIVPENNGQQNLLDIINAAPLQEIRNALDNAPVPFVLEAQAGGGAPIIINEKAGKPVRIDVDRNKQTGQGGFDLLVEVNTVLLPVPSLVMEVTRLGGAPFVEDVQVLVAFPFDAFTTEALPGAPNLFMGFRTTAAGGEPGGHAPAYERIELTPGALAGTDHLYDITMTTIGADNPLLFLLGHFDGDHLTGSLNAAALGAHVETASGGVPELINVGLDVNAALIGVPAPSASLGLEWDASELSITTLTYLEAEDLANAHNDFASTIRFDMMPLHEELSFNYTPNQALVLSHRGSSVVDEVEFRHERRDGSSFTITAQQVPTEVDLAMAMSLAGDTAVLLDVNDNTMDLTVEAIQLGGFPGTQALLGFELGYVEIAVEDAVDLRGGFIAQLPIINGLIDVDGDGTVTPQDSGSIGGTTVIGGLMDTNDDAAITPDDIGIVFGFNVLGGMVDVNRDGVVDGNDDGAFSGILSVFARNPGESIRRMHLIGDDHAHYDEMTGELIGLELAPSWNDDPLHHVISFIEDGTHGTVAARLLNFSEVVFDLRSSDLTQALRLVTGQPAPMQLYLSFSELSNFLAGPNDDILIVADIDDLPAGQVKLLLTPPSNIGYEIEPPSDIALVHLYGHIGLMNFDVAVGDLPPVLVFSFDPTGSFSLIAEDGMGGADMIGLLALRLFETQVAIIDGMVDVNLDGAIDSDDDGTLLRYALIDGGVDTDGDGDIDGDDVGLVLGFEVTAGLLDVSGDGVVDGDDDATVAQVSPGLAGSESLLGRPLKDVHVRVDHAPSLNGTWGAVARLPFTGATGSVAPAGQVVMDGQTGSTAVLRLPTPNLTDGELELIGLQGPGFAKDSALLLLPSLSFDAQTGPFTLGEVIVGATSGAMATVRRVQQLAGRGTLWLSNLEGGAFAVGEALLVNGVVRAVAGAVTPAASWNAVAAHPAVGAGFAMDIGTAADDAYLGGFQVAVATAADAVAPLSARTAASIHHLELVSHDTYLGDVRPPAHLKLGAFGIDQVSLVATDVLEARFAADATRTLNVQIHRDFGTGFFEGANDRAMDVTLNVSGLPQSLELSTDFTAQFDYVASTDIDGITLDALIDPVNDGLLNLAIRGAAVDLNDDGAIDADDTGFIGDTAVISGLLDLDGSGVVDADDDGEFRGATIFDGGVDVDGDDDADGDDDNTRNGTEVVLNLLDLPAEIHLRAAPAAATLIGGLLDLNLDEAIDGEDRGSFAAFDVIQGALDANGDGTIDEDDDATLFETAVIDGQIDVNGDGAIGEGDSGQFSGMQFNSSGGIKLLELLIRDQTDGVGLIEGTSLMEVMAMDLPANVLLASRVNSIIFESTDGDDLPKPLTHFSALISESKDPARIAQLRAPFQQTEAGPTGAVLDGSTPSRINYTPYLQELNSRYYDSGDATGVLERLALLYADGQVLDEHEERVVMRQLAGRGIYTDVRLSGFQKVEGSWMEGPNPLNQEEGADPILVRADFLLEAPTTGTHPLFIGLSTSEGTIVGALEEPDDRGFLRGTFVGLGRVDLNDDRDITNDNGEFAGFAVIDSQLDINDDGQIDEADDGYIDGIRVIDGSLDISEEVFTVQIENVPDRIEVSLDIDAARITFESVDDAVNSIGDIDVYSGRMPYTPDHLNALRLRLFDTPESVEVTWGLGFPGGGINVDASNEFELLALVQGRTEDSTIPPVRIVGGLTLEDIQIGCDLEIFSFDVAKELELSLGQAIINGGVDINDDNVINNQDDGQIGGFLGLGATPVINGSVDVNSDGEIDGDDDGNVGGFVIINGGVDVNESGAVTDADDFENTILAIPIAWDLLRGTIGIDNDAESTEIDANFDKAAINGFLDAYVLTVDPVALDPDGPEPFIGGGSPAVREYVPYLSVVLDEFRELSASLGVILDPFTLDALPGISFDSDVDISGTLIFDFWVRPVIDATLTIDFPDWTGLADLEIGVLTVPDYSDNTPLHLFPITGIFFTLDGAILTQLGLHEFNSHEDPYA